MDILMMAAVARSAACLPSVEPRPILGPWTVVLAPLSVALSTFFAKLVWSATTTLIRIIRFRHDQVLVACPLDLSWLDKELESLNINGVRIFCLLVRFGDDDYLTKIASDQERFEGKLLNQVIPVDRTVPNVKLYLPVHRRLGTQFKLYFHTDQPKDAAALWKRLQPRPINATGEEPTDSQRQIILDSTEPKGRKVWFRLAAYGESKTVEGYQNSMFPASRIKGFEEKNLYKPSRWSRPGEPELEVLQPSL